MDKIRVIGEDLGKEDLNKLISLMINNNELEIYVDRVIEALDSGAIEINNFDEEFYKEEDLTSHDGYMGILINEKRYFINLKLGTIYSILFIIGNTPDIGNFLVEGAGLIGLSSGCIIKKINEENGEMCIVREVSKGRLTYKDIEITKNKECINNDLNCKFKESGMCKICEQEIEGVIKDLIDKRVVKDKMNKYVICI